jgi:predicted Rossmann fold nucleotide-binding protein DprA/Smf involved in DNA uptake
MRVTVCGSRSIGDIDLVKYLISNSEFEITEVIEGGAHGVDTIAGEWARERNIPVTVVEPDWSIGLYAGPKRNEQMVRMSDAVIAIWDGKSRGTASTIEYAKKYGKPIKIWEV